MGFLLLAGFGIAVVYTLHPGSTTAGTVINAPIPPNLQTPPSSNTGQLVPQISGPLQVSQGDVAIAIPYNSGDSLQARLAHCDQVNLIVTTAAGPQAFNNLVVLRSGTTNPGAPVTAAAAPGAGTAAAGAAPVVVSTGSLIVEVPRGLAPAIVGATVGTPAIQFIYLPPVKEAANGSC